MSREAVEALVGKMKADDEFRAEILAAKGLEERLELARKAGFDCTADEIGELRTELADGDLAAAGGARWKGREMLRNGEWYCSA